MQNSDRIRAFVAPVHGAAVGWLESHVPQSTFGMLAGLLDVLEATLLVAAMAYIAARLQPLLSDPAPQAGRRRVVIAVRAAAAVVAAALYALLVRSIDGDLMGFFARWDHLAFAAVGGLALAGMSASVRKLSLTTISLHLLYLHSGREPILLVLGAGIAGYALLHLFRGASNGTTALVQGLVLAGAAALCWIERSSNGILALRMQGAFGFFLFRHISFVVEVRRGMPAGPLDYLCYMFFYTSFVGATEVYNEFGERNLTGTGHYDYRAAVRKIVIGLLATWASFQVGIRSHEVVLITDPLQLWSSMVVMFLRSGLFVTGLWATIEGAALLYGVVLRPNFTGVLTSENPSQFWRAWRGTMTNWLIRYIYIPLGGNRRHQVMNIAGAFVVSTAWHCMGIPFFAWSVTWMDFMPIVLWGTINAVAVIAHSRLRGVAPDIAPDATPEVLRRGTKVLLTFVFASFTVMLLDFRPQTTALFLPFLRHLFGLD